MKGGEILVALVLIGFCILGWIATTNFDVEVSMTNTLGPAIFPQILLGGIAAGSLFLIFQVMRDRLDRGTVKWGKSSKVFLAAGAMLFQALTFEELSTFVAAGITLPTLLWIANVRGGLGDFFGRRLFNGVAGTDFHVRKFLPGGKRF